MELGVQSLKVQRASIGVTQAAGIGHMGVNAMSMLAGTTSNDLEQGRVLQLLNMVTSDELMDNDEYAGTSTPPQPSLSPLTSPLPLPPPLIVKVDDLHVDKTH